MRYTAFRLSYPQVILVANLPVWFCLILTLRMPLLSLSCLAALPHHRALPHSPALLSHFTALPPRTFHRRLSGSHSFITHWLHRSTWSVYNLTLLKLLSLTSVSKSCFWVPFTGESWQTGRKFDQPTWGLHAWSKRWWVVKAHLYPGYLFRAFLMLRHDFEGVWTVTESWK